MAEAVHDGAHGSLEQRVGGQYARLALLQQGGQLPWRVIRHLQPAPIHEQVAPGHRADPRQLGPRAGVIGEREFQPGTRLERFHLAILGAVRGDVGGGEAEIVVVEIRRGLNQRLDAVGDRQCGFILRRRCGGRVYLAQLLAVVGMQLTKQSLDIRLLESDIGQAVTQRPLDAGQHLPKRLPGFRGLGGTAAGDEFIDEMQRHLELGRIIAVAQQQQHHVIGPCAGQYAMDQRRQFVGADSLDDFPGGATTCVFQLFAAAGGFGHAQLGQIRAFHAQFLELLQVRQEPVENAHVIIEFVQQLFDDGLDLLVQAPVAVGFVGPALRLFRQAVEQAPCRMLAMREKLAIDDGRFQIGNLQSSQQYLHLRWQVAVFQDEFEQHADQVDGVLVDRGHLARPCTTQGPDLAQQLFLQRGDLVAEVGTGQAGGRWLRVSGGYLVLQHAECAQQLVHRGQRAAGIIARPAVAAFTGIATTCTEQRMQGLQQVAGNVARLLAGHALAFAIYRRGRSRRTGRLASHVGAQLGQYASANKLRVDRLIQLLERRQYIAVEQFVDNQLHAHVGTEFVQCRAECLGQDRGRDGVVAVVDLVAAANDRQAMIDGEQIAGHARFVLADHAGDRQRFLQFVVGNQRQLNHAGRGGGMRCRRPAAGQFAQFTPDGGQEQPLHRRPTLAHIAHAVEVVHLGRIVLGLFGQVE